VLHAGEDRLERVEILLADRIELVVVAGGAGDRETEERRRSGVDDVAELFVPLHRSQHRVRTLHLVIGAGDQIAGGGVDAAGIAGQLFADELRVRQVAVEGIDDVVAIGPRTGARRVGLETGGLGKVDQVQPEGGPAFAIPRRRQCPIDQPLIGVGPGVADELRALGGRRQQPVHQQMDAAYQQPGLGRRRWLQTGGAQAGEHEPVDVVAAPAVVVDGRRRHGPHRLERPMGHTRRCRPRGLCARRLRRLLTVTDSRSCPGNADPTEDPGHHPEANSSATARHGSTAQPRRPAGMLRQLPPASRQESALGVLLRALLGALLHQRLLGFLLVDLLRLLAFGHGDRSS